MSDRNKDWVPVVAGICLGLGALALLYKLWGGSGSSHKPGVYNQQQGAPYKCTCPKYVGPAAWPVALWAYWFNVCTNEEERQRQLAAEQGGAEGGGEGGGHGGRGGGGRGGGSGGRGGGGGRRGSSGSGGRDVGGGGGRGGSGGGRGGGGVGGSGGGWGTGGRGSGSGASGRGSGSGADGGTGAAGDKAGIFESIRLLFANIYDTLGPFGILNAALAMMLLGYYGRRYWDWDIHAKLSEYISGKQSQGDREGDKTEDGEPKKSRRARTPCCNECFSECRTRR